MTTRPTPLSASKFLFLDFDGVLHPESGDPEMHFCFMPNFCEVLTEVAPKMDLPIVISSAWRSTNTLAELKAHFPEKLRPQIVGVTPELDLEPGYPALRQLEIESWMQTNAPVGSAWLAIDDRASFFQHDCSNLFLVPGFGPNCGAGLNTEVCALFKNRLGEFLLS